MKVILFTCTESFDELTSRRLGFLDPGISSHSLDITSKKKKKSKMIVRKTHALHHNSVESPSSVLSSLIGIMS